MWQLRHGGDAGIGSRIESLGAAAREIEALAMATPDAERVAGFRRLGAPDSLAEKLARLSALLAAPDIALVAAEGDTALSDAARIHGAVDEALGLARIEAALRSFAATDYFDGLALWRAGDMIGAARRAIAAAALRGGGGDPVAIWLARRDPAGTVRAQVRAIADGGEITVSRLTVAAGLLGDLAGG